jgi:hypothetical protein
LQSTSTVSVFRITTCAETWFEYKLATSKKRIRMIFLMVLIFEIFEMYAQLKTDLKDSIHESNDY